MENQKTKATTLKKIGKFFLFGTCSLILIIFVLNWIWTLSGSNQWELEIDKDGTKVYSLKMPGSTIKKIKGITYYKYSLSQIVAPFLDESIQGNCAEWAAGCLEYKILKSWNPRFQTNLQQWKFELFPPFSHREMLLQGQLRQDKQTKEVFIENIAVPNIIPQDESYVRLTHVHNTWRYTPLTSGEVQVEFVQDLDMGGLFPDLLLNLGGPDEVYKMLHHDVPESLKKEKYRKAKFNFIEEPSVLTM